MAGHLHAWPHDKEGPRCVEIGDGVCIRTVGIYGRPGVVGGFIIAHEVHGEGKPRCEGHVCVEGCREDHGWTMTGTLDGGDLTLAPSVQCTVHASFHAHVTDGRWTGPPEPSGP